MPAAPAPPTGFPARAVAIGVGINAVILYLLRGQIAGVLARGVHPHWPDMSLMIAAGPATMLHTAAALIALAVSLYMLAAPKGDRAHRTVGWAWAVVMMTVALSSFFVRALNPGHLSWIHILSGWTAFATPLGIWAARTHRVKLHRGMMTGLVVGGLLVAGALTFIPGRLMWNLFFG